MLWARAAVHEQRSCGSAQTTIELVWLMKMLQLCVFQLPRFICVKEDPACWSFPSVKLSCSQSSIWMSKIRINPPPALIATRVRSVSVFLYVLFFIFMIPGLVILLDLQNEDIWKLWCKGFKVSVYPCRRSKHKRYTIEDTFMKYPFDFKPHFINHLPITSSTISKSLHISQTAQTCQPTQMQQPPLRVISFLELNIHGSCDLDL